MWILLVFVIFIPDVDCQCGETVTLKEGQYYVFQTPGYPGSYPRNARCIWTITAPSSAETVTLYCPNVDIFSHSPCFYDYMMFTGYNDRLCGKGPINFTVSTKIFQTMFLSTTNLGTGFKCAVFASLLGTTLTDPITENELPFTGACKCGVRQTLDRIVNGQPTEVHEYPWQVTLRDSKHSHFCGGALISPTYVITAAHCIKANTLSYVSIGDHHLDHHNETFETIHLQVAQAVTHPKYKELPFHENDIGLLKLSRPVNFNQNIHAVCLPFKHKAKTFARNIGTVIGWGKTSFGGKPTEVLYEANIPIITNSRCSGYYNTTIPQETMLCAYGKGKDACQGDSGGPMMVSMKGNDYLVGIVSWGIGCGLKKKPGVYTRVTNYLQWITTIVETSDVLCYT